MRSLLWENWFAKGIRWLIFLPLAFTAAGVLQIIPPFAVNYARTVTPEFNLLTLALIFIGISVVTTVSWLWFVATWTIPVLSCAIVAPNRKIASVIFGTLWCLFYGLALLSWLLNGKSILFLVYHLVFFALVFAGTIMTYVAEEEI